MHLYQVTPTAGPELSVFADSFDQASNLFMAWWLVHQNDPLPSFEVKQRNRAWLGPDTQLLEEALSRDLAGIGHFDPAKGWTIVSPAYVEEEA